MDSCACSVFRPDAGNLVKVESEEKIQFLLETGESITFIGACILKCLAGSCEVNGYVIKEGNPSFTIFSPKTQSLLSINHHESKTHNSTQSSVHPNLQSAMKQTKCCVVEIVSMKSVDSGYNLHEKYPEMFFHSGYNPNYSITGCYLIFSSLPETLMLHIPKEWLGFGEKLLNNTENIPIVIACGQRKLGKSTFCRWLLNFMLNKFPKVAFLNLDLSQTEFSPVGMLDLNVIEQPVFGPPFTHLKLPDDARFMGELSPGNSPVTYIRQCFSLFQSYQSCFASEGIPLIINTMGWITGLGCEIHRHLFNFIPVTNVVSFVEAEPCTVEYLDEPTSFPFIYTQGFKRLVPRANPTNTNILAVPWLSASKPSLAKANRDSMLTFYFNSIFEQPCWPSCNSYQTGRFRVEKLSMQTPYSVCQRDICVEFHPKEIKVAPDLWLNALNLSIVGLCIIVDKFNASREKYVKSCVGLGIIRNIDQTKKIFYVITPVPLFLLRKVNCFVKGQLEISSALLEDEDNLPYVSTMHAQDLLGARGPSTRQFIERKKFRQR